MTDSFLVLSQDHRILNFQGLGMWGWDGLKKSIQTVLQFFQLQENDVIILNDPMAGGLFPWAVTAIHRVGTNYIARAIRVETPWNFADKIDGEALRIPPTPIVQNGVLQTEIFNSLISHPQAGPHFSDTLKNLVDRKRAQSLCPIESQARSLSKSTASSLIEKLRQDLPNSEGRSEIVLSSGEILKLRMETSDRGFMFDFSGTSPGQKCFLNETTLHGLCQQYLTQFLNLNAAQSIELASLTQFLTPRSSFLQAKFPQGQLQGLARGSGAVWHSIQKCLKTIYSRQVWPLHSFFPLWIQVQGHGHLSQWVLPCGSGAQEKDHGLSAFSMDGISKTPTVQQLQKYFEIDEYSLTPSQFQSRMNPGLGLSLHLRAKNELQFLWIHEVTNSAATNGASKFTALESNKILLRGEELPPIGNLTLRPGDTLQIQTGAGAGLI